MKLECSNVTKTYGKKEALSGFSFEFTPGIYGLLGPNGAGKTTLINLMTDNLKAGSGDIFYNGNEIYKLGKEYRSKVGFMPQQQNIYPSFTVERFLFYMAGLKGLDRKRALGECERLLEMVNLGNDRKKRMGELSGGMKQRALLAQALLGSPEIIILDEPTAGVDPKERIQIRNIIAGVGLECIILIATHIVTDVQFIAKEIILLDNGKIAESGVPAVLLKKMIGKVFEIETDEEHYKTVSKKFRVAQMYRSEDKILLRVVNREKPMEYNYREMTPDLEDLYLYHFG